MAGSAAAGRSICIVSADGRFRMEADQIQRLKRGAVSRPQRLQLSDSWF